MSGKNMRGLKGGVIPLTNQRFQVGKSVPSIIVKKLIDNPPQKNGHPVRRCVYGRRQDEVWRRWCAVSECVSE